MVKLNEVPSDLEFYSTELTLGFLQRKMGRAMRESELNARRTDSAMIVS